MGLEADQDDVEDIVQSHNRHFTNKDRQELERFIEHDRGGKEQNQDDPMITSEIKEILITWVTLTRLLYRHPGVKQSFTLHF
jgi:hypothetical protein